MAGFLTNVTGFRPLCLASPKDDVCYRSKAEIWIYEIPDVSSARVAAETGIFQSLFYPRQGRPQHNANGHGCGAAP